VNEDDHDDGDVRVYYLFSYWRLHIHVYAYAVTYVDLMYCGLKHVDVFCLLSIKIVFVLTFRHSVIVGIFVSMLRCKFALFFVIVN